MKNVNPQDSVNMTRKLNLLRVEKKRYHGVSGVSGKISETKQ